LTAAKTLAEQITDADLRQGGLYPLIQKTRDLFVQIEMAVAYLACDHELASVPRANDMKAYIKSKKGGV
jgi:malate dehydrogenase (oxaloacetate-decarboxylating)(NADP+)